jgi:hypothetical protein
MARKKHKPPKNDDDRKKDDSKKKEKNGPQKIADNKQKEREKGAQQQGGESNSESSGWRVEAAAIISAAKSPRKLAKWPDVWTAVIAAVILAVGGAAIAGLKWVAYDLPNTREQIREEIGHRVPTAQKHVVTDPDLALKFLNGVDPLYCLHEEYRGVALPILLDNLRSAWGTISNPNLLKFAAIQRPSPEQVAELVKLLGEEFPPPNGP